MSNPMTPSPELVEKVARDICREQCAFMGEPPCFTVGEWPNPNCNEPGCQATALAAITAMQPALDALDELAQLKDGRSAILPQTREHAEHLYIVAEACLRQYGETPDQKVVRLESALSTARREALEEAAKVADNLRATRMHEANEAFAGRDQGSAIIYREQGEAASEIAAAIRALQDRPNGNE